VKRLEVLREFVPQARQIAMTRAQLESAARALGVQLTFFEAQDPAQIARALDTIAVVEVDAASPRASARAH